MRAAISGLTLFMVCSAGGSSSSAVFAQVHDIQDRTVTAEDGTSVQVRTAMVRVPELRDHPSGTGSIDLAVVRVRRADSASRSAHVVLAGGPGDSGVDLVLGMARRGGAVMRELFDGDIIGMDQRGSGKSVPNLSTLVRYDLPLNQPASSETWLPLMEDASRAVAASFRARGIRLEAYNTRESAEDLNAVREALGYAHLTLWGRSHGSHLALATLRQHPEIVERMVLINPEGPDQTWKLPSQVDAILDRLSERAQVPDLVTQMRRVIDGLAKQSVRRTVMHPITRELVEVTIGSFDVQWITAQALGDPRAMSTLPAAYREMDAGNFLPMAQLAVTFRARLGVESAMKQMMDVSSGATTERRARIHAETAGSVLGNAINFPAMYLEKTWGRPDLGDEFRQPVESEVRTLILAGDMDPRTPVENGREIVRTLSNGQLVVVENASHLFDVFGSEPIRDVLRQFLAGGKVTDRVTLPPVVFQR